MITAVQRNATINQVQTVLARAAAASVSALGAEQVPEAVVFRLVTPLAKRLPARGLFVDQIGLPHPAVLASVLRVTERTGAIAEPGDGDARALGADNGTYDALYDAALNLLAASMRRETALRVTAQHGHLLEQFSCRDLAVIDALATTRSHAWLQRCELRFETVRRDKIIPRRLRMIEEHFRLRGAPPPSPFSVEETDALERAGLVAWVDSSVTPRNSYRFLRAWRQMRLGRVPFRVGLQRWLAGQHMAPIQQEDRQPLRGDVVGGIEIHFRTLELTDSGRTWVQLTQPARWLGSGNRRR